MPKTSVLSKNYSSRARALLFLFRFCLAGLVVAGGAVEPYWRVLMGDSVFGSLPLVEDLGPSFDPVWPAPPYPLPARGGVAD